MENLKRSSTSRSFGQTHTYSVKSSDLNNNKTNRMLLSSTKSTRQMSPIIKINPAAKANSLDSILKEHNLFKSCSNNLLKNHDSKEESITLVQVLPDSNLSPIAPENNKYFLSPKSQRKSSKRSSDCRWSISADGNILILQIADELNEPRTDPSHASKRMNKLEQEKECFEQLKVTKKMTRSTNSTDLASKNVSNINNKNNNPAKLASLYDHIGSNGYLKSSKNSLKHLKEKTKKYEVQNYQPLWQSRDKAGLQNGYQNFNISNLCEIYDASPTKLHLTKQKKLSANQTNKMTANSENLQNQSINPTFTRTIGRNHTKKIDVTKYEKSLEKITDYTPIRTSLQKLIHVTSV